MNRQTLPVAALLLLAGGLVIRKRASQFVNYLNPRFNLWALVPAAAANSLAKLRAEDQAFSAFAVAFRAGPAAPAENSPFVAPASAESEPVAMFFARSPELLGQLQELLRKISATTDESARRTAFADLHRELRALKGAAGLSELLPVWQMASAVEGLVKQLTDKAGNITPSTLRTVVGGVNLLKDLCVPGLRADLLTHPPIRLLAVDDDLISRKAVSLALKKALNPPDLAENGAAALALATEHAYDGVFLDVQMPDMDGFEVCTKIHETVPNANTPVVFVTCLSDFDSRAKSEFSGGSDLIAKPFLTFEITVKALTLVVQRRLQAHAQTAAAGNQAQGVPRSTSNSGNANGDLPAMFTDDHRYSQLLSGPAPSGELSPADPLTRAFLTRASAQLGALRDLVQAIFQATDAAARQDMLADFYLLLSSLRPATGSAKGHPAMRMLAAMEGLLKKLLQNPKHSTSSTLFTLATGVDVLNELCADGVRADLATNPPIRILVADDNPVARRAITCALQTAFEKPEDVECGEAALAAAREKTFDVIFLDVQMPRMDGFTVSSKIRETGRNRTTPVVFVTGQSDFKSRAQATLSGGNDLMGKPFLTAEVTVKALTFALRGRLRKLRTGAHWLSAANEASAVEASSSGNSAERADERRAARHRARRFKRARQSWYQSA